MVCYNITAYNEIINFTVSKREVYNSKLRAGIKAERGMVMKGKNLERAVILGLLLSTGVYGTAWAKELSNPEIEGDTITVNNENLDIMNDNYPTYNEKTLKDFKKVTVNQFADSDGDHGMKIWTAQAKPGSKYVADFSNTDFIINVTGESSNSDAIHLSGFENNVKMKNLTATVSTTNSDIINIGREATSSVVEILGDLDGTVYNGSGIRANSQEGHSNTEMTSTIIVRGNTTINLLDNKKNTSFNPAAVFAGDDAVEKFWVIPIGPKESKGQGIIVLGEKNKRTEVNLYLERNNSYGILAGKNGNITVNSDLNISSKNKDTDKYAINVSGIVAADMNFSYQDRDVSNIANRHGSTVTLNGINNVIDVGESGRAISASSQYGVVQTGENGIGNIDVIGDIFADDNGKIDLAIRDWGDITGNIEAINGANIKLGMANNNSGNSFARSTAGAINITGDVQAANGATIDLSLGDGAYFEGRVDDYKDADSALWDDSNFNHNSLFDEDFVKDNKVESSGSVNLTLGNNAVWNLTEQSWVSKVDGNSGFIYLDGDGTGGYAVHIGKLEGDHTFVLNLNPKEHEFSDMLYIYDGSTAGVQNLRINNEAEVLNALKNDGDRIRFATVGKTAGAGAGFGDDYVVRGRGVINSGFSIDYVDYDTDTDQGNYNGDGFSAAKPGDDYVDSIYGSGNNNSETGSQASTLENNAGTGNKPVAELDSKNLYLVRDSSKDAGKSDSGATIINMSRANYKNAIYMDRLNKRMGEMRYVNAEEEQGLWVRLRHDRIGQSGDFRSMNTMYEVGYDVKQPTDNGEHRIGMAIDYMRGSTTYDDIMGKGETKRYGLWLYDTWLGEKGHYTDYIVKWGHLSNDFDIRDKDSLENITGDYSNNVFSVSAEYGKKNDMGNNWYFEPQAQIQLARVTGADYVTTQGSKVNVDGINSLIGRAGFRIGRDMDENSTVYLKADLLHEFMGDQTVTAADATGTLREEFENKGTWYDVGFGFATKMSKNSYAFMDFEKSFGNDNDETYQINAGMQWTF